jgi:beta-galactosidase
MREAGLDYALFDLETVTAERLAAHASVTVPGGPFLHRHVQDLLAEYAASGGEVVLDGPAPHLDEDLRPYTVLADALGSAGVTGTAPVPGDVLDESSEAAGAPAARVVSGHADAFLRTHPSRDVQYLTVLVQSDNDGPVRVETPHGVVELVSAQGGAAVVRLAGGALDDFVVKGLNGFLDSAVPARVSMNDVESQADRPADLARVGGTVRLLY